MSQILGIDHSSQIISALERRLNEKGILFQFKEVGLEATYFTAVGMGNGKKVHASILKLTEQPSDEDAAKLVDQYLEQVESGLRSAPMPSEEAE